MNRIFLSDDDVITMSADYNFTKTPTSQIKEVKQVFMRDWLKNLSNWMWDGMACSVMFGNRIGWYKGKVFLRIEFVPNNPDEFFEPEQTTEPKSPLDDLRKNLSS